MLGVRQAVNRLGGMVEGALYFGDPGRGKPFVGGPRTAHERNEPALLFRQPVVGPVVGLQNVGHVADRRIARPRVNDGTVDRPSRFDAAAQRSCTARRTVSVIASGCRRRRPLDSGGGSRRSICRSGVSRAAATTVRKIHRSLSGGAARPHERDLRSAAVDDVEQTVGPGDHLVGHVQSKPRAGRGEAGTTPAAATNGALSPSRSGVGLTDGLGVRLVVVVVMRHVVVYVYVLRGRIVNSCA